MPTKRMPSLTPTRRMPSLTPTRPMPVASGRRSERSRREDPRVGWVELCAAVLAAALAFLALRWMVP